MLIFFAAESSKLGLRDWISQLKHSCIAFLVHKSMSDHQSWFHQEVQRKANVSSSYAIRRQDISKSAQRFQIAIDEVKVRLRLALSLGTWLMPSNLLLDTQSAVGYNSSLKKATSEMKFRVNSSVNLEMKSVGVGLMNGGSSKINKPTPQAFGQATERQAPRGQLSPQLEFWWRHPQG